MATAKGEMQRHLLFWHRDPRLPPPFVAGIARSMLPLWSPKTIFKLVGIAPYVERSVEPFVVHRWQPPAMANLPQPPSVLVDDAWFAPKVEDYKLNHIAVVPDGVAFKNGSILDSAGRYLSGASHKHSVHTKEARRSAGVHCVPHSWTPAIEKVSGPIIVATTGNSSDYYHWLVDVLPRLLHARRLGYDKAKIYVEAARPFQQQSLALAGIPDALIVDADRYPVIEAGELVVPCHSIFPGAALPQWLIELIQTTFKVPVVSPEKPRRLYVSRADATTRRIVNERDAEALLHDYGFELVRLTDFTFAEQIGLFSAAEAVAGPHGGGLANLLFCRPGTRVLELFPAFNKSDVYWVLASAMTLQYSYLKNPVEDVSGRGDADFEVNLAHLRLALESMNLGAEDGSARPAVLGNTDRAPCI